MLGDESLSFRVQLPWPWTTQVAEPDNAHPAEALMYQHVSYRVRAFFARFGMPSC